MVGSWGEQIFKQNPLPPLSVEPANDDIDNKDNDMGLDLTALKTMTSPRTKSQTLNHLRQAEASSLCKNFFKVRKPDTKIKTHPLAHTFPLRSECSLSSPSFFWEISLNLKMRP